MSVEIGRGSAPRIGPAALTHQRIDLEGMMDHAKRIHARALRLARAEGDPSKVIELLEAAYEAGSPDAAYGLGDWIHRGKYPNQKKTRAFRLMKYAADHGSRWAAMACCNVGASYEGGLGVKKNLKQAFAYYLRSAFLGDENGCFEVCRCLYYGIGTRKDQALALFLEEIFTKAGTFKVRQ